MRKRVTAFTPSKSTPKRRYLSAITVLGIVMMTQIVGMGTAAAYSKSEACKSKYLCFKDYETNNWGRFSGTNPRWSKYGWDNRADYFENHGTRCDAQVYKNTNYKTRFLYLRRGQTAVAGSGNWDTASSNNWTNCQ